MVPPDQEVAPAWQRQYREEAERFLVTGWVWFAGTGTNWNWNIYCCWALLSNLVVFDIINKSNEILGYVNRNIMNFKLDPGPAEPGSRDLEFLSAPSLSWFCSVCFPHHRTILFSCFSVSCLYPDPGDALVIWGHSYIGAKWIIYYDELFFVLQF